MGAVFEVAVNARRGSGQQLHDAARRAADLAPPARQYLCNIATLHVCNYPPL
jgi:hypothetical protein